MNYKMYLYLERKLQPEIRKWRRDRFKQLDVYTDAAYNLVSHPLKKFDSDFYRHLKKLSHEIASYYFRKVNNEKILGN